MKQVIQIGPINSKGGISSVMKSLILNAPSGFVINTINSHSDRSKLQMTLSWITSIFQLIKMLNNKNIDIVHIHVTHGLSWFRKLSIMKICDFYGASTVIHIHSGKFDIFCKSAFGLFGYSVKKNLSKENRLIVILENRWKILLDEWLPSNYEIIHNSSLPIERNIKNDECINLLCLSRNGDAKNLSFCLEILDYLSLKGFYAKLNITGLVERDIKKYSHLEVKAHGWITNDEKNTLISVSDILISPSHYEGSSMSVIESLVSGLPVIVSDASRQTVGSDEFVVQDMDVGLWCDKILEIKDNYQNMSNLAFKNGEKYGMSKSKMKWAKTYEKICKKLDP